MLSIFLDILLCLMYLCIGISTACMTIGIFAHISKYEPLLQPMTDIEKAKHTSTCIYGIVSSIIFGILAYMCFVSHGRLAQIFL